MRQLLVFGAFLAVAPVTGALAQGAGDPAAGQRVFNQCRACHSIEQGGRNQIGPNLHGVFGRKAGSIEGFRYSENLKELGAGGHTWSEETLRPYLTNPKDVAPKGIMNFAGIRNPQQLNDLLAYLKQASGAS